MKKVSILVGLLVFLGANLAFAATPTLTVMSASGTYFQINVTGDANHQVNLYYYPSNSSSLSSIALGNTTSGGTFTTTITPTSYNIPSGSSVYVTVNGQQSSSVTWPYHSGNNNYQQVSASQSNVYLNYGQSSTVYLSGGTGIYYVYNNSNPSVVSTSVNGSVLTLQGQSNGSSNLSICSSVSTNSNYYTYNSCVPIFVSVGTSYHGGNTGNPTYNYPTYTYPAYTSYPRTGVNISGVLLSNLPYTGVEENLKMAIFVLGLMIWSGFLAYMYIAKRHLLLGTPVSVSMSDRIAEFKKQNMVRKQDI